MSLIIPSPSPPSSASVQKGNFETPYVIRKIYEAALRDNHILTCEKLDWMFPTGYKIGIYNRVMLKFMKLDGVTHTYADPADWEIATFILQAGKTPILCPLAKDTNK